MLYCWLYLFGLI